MKKLRVLLTGDDGYNSIGTRVLVHLLKNEFDLSIAATYDQMSGVGGHGNFKHGGTWRETEVDGVKALCVDGYPVDAVECALAYFKKPFDLVISGINLGSNVSGSLITSGTLAAAYRALIIGLTSQAIAISWHLPVEFWKKDHAPDENITPYIDYPGKTAVKIIQFCREQKYWNTQLLNINFPLKPSSTIVFTRPHPDITQVFKYPLSLNRILKTYSYPPEYSPTLSQDSQYDIGALEKGLISITPCKPDFLNEELYQKLRSFRFNLNS